MRYEASEIKDAVLRGACVADLEAVREHTGGSGGAAGSLLGAQIATVYLTSHPEQVSAAVLSSPGQSAIGELTPVPRDPPFAWTRAGISPMPDRRPPGQASVLPARATQQFYDA